MSIIADFEDSNRDDENGAGDDREEFCWDAETATADNEEEHWDNEIAAVENEDELNDEVDMTYATGSEEDNNKQLSNKGRSFGFPIGQRRRRQKGNGDYHEHINYRNGAQSGYGGNNGGEDGDNNGQNNDNHESGTGSWGGGGNEYNGDDIRYNYQKNNKRDNYGDRSDMRRGDRSNMKRGGRRETGQGGQRATGHGDQHEMVHENYFGTRHEGEGGSYKGGKNRRYNNNDESTKPKKEFYIPPEPTEDENEIFNSGISSGINFNKYDKIPIQVSGQNIPQPIKFFKESGLRDFVLANVKKSGYTVPTPIQKNAIPIIMEKRDLMACAQTGSGKTAAFLLPIINDLLNSNDDLYIGRPHALIVAPTRELGIQIFNEARKYSLGSFLKLGLVYGGPAVRYQSNNIQKGCHLLVATPGRLLHFVNMQIISFEDIKFVVLDEADRMLDMGFIPDVEKIMLNATMPGVGEKQCSMFSATFPDDIQRLAGQFLDNYIFLSVGILGSACTDVEQVFYKVSKYDKRGKLLELLAKSSKGTIIFVETRRNTDFLASFLSESKFPTTCIHGHRLQREREMAINDFKKGKMDILIATSVAARGLDIKNVEHVINYDLPKSIDEYVHRIGRTGRLGNFGRASSLYDPNANADIAQGLVKILKQANQEVPDFLKCVDSSAIGSGRFRSGFGGHDLRDNIEIDQSSSTVGMNLEPLESDEDWN